MWVTAQVSRLAKFTCIIKNIPLKRTSLVSFSVVEEGGKHKVDVTNCFSASGRVKHFILDRVSVGCARHCGCWTETFVSCCGSGLMFALSPVRVARGCGCNTDGRCQNNAGSLLIPQSTEKRAEMSQ